MKFFDPDVRWQTSDKVEHLVGGIGIAFLVALILLLPHNVALVLLVILVGAAFELGQWDIARDVPELHTIPTDKTSPFLPGYGFGLLDLLADFLGGILYLIVRIFI